MTTPTDDNELEIFFERIWKRIADMGIDTSKMAYDFDKAKSEAKFRLNQLIAQKQKEVLEKLKSEMKMHTVPEGKRLITRSYLENSIDFMIKTLSSEGD